MMPCYMRVAPKCILQRRLLSHQPSNQSRQGGTRCAQQTRPVEPAQQLRFRSNPSKHWSRCRPALPHLNRHRKSHVCNRNSPRQLQRWQFSRNSWQNVTSEKLRRRVQVEIDHHRRHLLCHLQPPRPLPVLTSPPANPRPSRKRLFPPLNRKTKR